MTTTVRTTAMKTTAMQRAPMDSLRKTALAAGACYLLTFISIPTLALYGPVHKAGYIIGSGPDTAVIVGAILEIIVALAGIGTAVALYPVVKRQNEAVALGFIGSRVLEAACIFVGVASLLSIVAVRQDGVGANAAVTGQALAAFYDSMFRISQGFIPAVNALLLGSLLYRSRLVPRALPLLGFVGAVLLVTSGAGSLFDLWGTKSAIAAIATMPIACWEFGLGVWLVGKGFNAASPVSQAARSAAEGLVPTA